MPEKPIEHARKVDMATLVSQIRLSYPILYILVNLALCLLFIAELAQKSFLEGDAIDLLQGVRVHAVDSDHFK